MNSRDENAYAALADVLHDSGPIEGEARPTFGADATTEGQRLLMLATGQTTVDSAIRVALGRPRLDADSVGPMWKVRATRALDDKVRSMASRMGISRSEFIRNAVAAYSISSQ